MEPPPEVACHLSFQSVSTCHPLKLSSPHLMEFSAPSSACVASFMSRHHSIALPTPMTPCRNPHPIWLILCTLCSIETALLDIIFLMALLLAHHGLVFHSWHQRDNGFIPRGLLELGRSILFYIRSTCIHSHPFVETSSRCSPLHLWPHLHPFASMAHGSSSCHARGVPHIELAVSLALASSLQSRNLLRLIMLILHLILELR